MRAAIYVRQSLSHKEGIDRQLSRCTAIAEGREYQIFDLYKDNEVSASKSRATSEWSRLLKDARRGKFDVVISVDLDRLVRSQADLLDLIETKVALLTVDGELDLTSAEGEFRASILASLARFEVKRKSERQKRANAYRVEQGLPSAGKRRYGYYPGNLKVREDEAAILRGIYSGLLDGKSLRSMAADLTRRGVPFRDKVVQWYPVRLRDMMNNPAYYGCIIVKGKAVPSEHVEPLIGKDVWENAQAILNDPSRKTNPGAPRKHLLSGIMVCGICGSKMRFTNGSYYCKTPIAGHPVIKGSAAEALVIDEVALAYLMGPAEPLRVQEGDDPRPLQEALAEVEAEGGRIMDDRREGRASPDNARRSLLMLKERRESIESELSRIRASSGAMHALGELAGHLSPKTRIVSLSGGGDPRKARDIFREEWERLTYDQKRDVIGYLLQITLYPGRKNRERMRIHHKIAVGLNEDEELSEVDVRVSGVS
ncbi:recombinase family protein [Leucobacter japonicus]|uniref:recombinase family protein n=1 Tax=Leucobacter japonicus TaxID=1461259 RepID=UPI0009494F44|nr:recombinase family protein [Leucobacter japonicus]